MSEYARAYEGSEPYIFVSYAHRDSEKILPVILALYGQKYRVWYDEGIAPGSEWPENIAAHLKNAALVMIFVSKYYLDSKNCLNEQKAAATQNKKTVHILLDEAAERFEFAGKDALHFSHDTAGTLVQSGRLGSDLIGDGVTGYSYTIDHKKAFNKWNLMLGAAAALAVVFAVALYGLSGGWFDTWIKQDTPPSEPAAATQEESIDLGDSMMGDVLTVSFTSGEEKEAVYEKLGWSGPAEMTYGDLMEMTGISQLEIGDEPIYDISFASYLPGLESVTLRGAHITDLSPLAACPNLKSVFVSLDMLPLTLPSPRGFEVKIG
jgi:hypothetical protein